MIVRGAVMRGVEEFLELGVGYRRPVDIERLHLQPLAMKSARRVFPWILHVDARIVATFDFDPAYGKIKIAAWNTNHAGGRGDGWFCRRHLNHGLRQILPFTRVLTERAFGALGHKGQQLLPFAGQFRSHEHRAKTKALDGKSQPIVAPGDVGSQLDAMPQVVVMHPVAVRYAQLLTRDVVFVAIDHRP